MYEQLATILPNRISQCDVVRTTHRAAYGKMPTISYSDTAYYAIGKAAHHSNRNASCMPCHT